MSLRIYNDQQWGTAADHSDELADLLTDAKPEVPLLAAEVSERILASALRDAAIEQVSPRAGLAGARLAMSAAFCVCLAGGMLFLRSVASEPYSILNLGGVKIVKHSTLPGITDPSTHTLADLSNSDRVIAKRLQSRRFIAAIRTASTHPRATADEDCRQSGYQAPPAPVCGITTFAIYTPVSDLKPPHALNDDRDDSAGESLLICIVTDDSIQPPPSHPLLPTHESAYEDIYDAIAGRYPDIVVDRQRVEALEFSHAQGPGSSSPLVLGCAAANAFCDDALRGKNDTFTMYRSARAPMVLSLDIDSDI